MNIKYRYNNMDVDSITAFASIKGRCSQGYRDVYFLRFLGGSPGQGQEVTNADKMLCQAMASGQLFYKRLKNLPFRMENGQSDYYLKSYDNWINSGKEKMTVHMTEGNPEFEASFGRGIREVCQEYAKVKKGISDSIEKNFILKLAWWADTVIDKLYPAWNEQSCIKIIAENTSKEQEYLFYYLLTLIGADVLLIQSRQDILVPDELKKLSREVKVGEYGTWNLPDFVYLPQKTETYDCTINKSNPVPNSASAGMEQAYIQGGANQNENKKVVVHIPQRKTREHSQPVSPVQEAAPSSSLNREKTFEELAQMASSIVMVAIHDKKGKVIGSGSGIMIGRDGYILTNYHVVAGGRSYSVRLEDDDNVYSTDEVIKYNSEWDLAIIRIDKTLTPIPIYDGRNKLVRGQKVVAIGSPLGLFNSVSDGIISGFRSMEKVDMIQFTAPISHGSSGGAVLNMYGEVIGISTAGFDDGQNINLAVPYDCIRMFARGFH